MNVGDLIDCKYGIGIVINVDRLYMGGWVTAVCAGQAQSFFVGWGETRVISESTNGNKEQETKGR
jgi:hypothetical protein